MVEVTILKVTHSGEQEARKLLPYFKASNVITPETPYASESRAIQHQAKWKAYLEANMSRSEFNSTVATKITDVYARKLLDYAFTSRLPLLHLERFPDAEAQKLDADYQAAKRLTIRGYTLVANGDRAGIEHCLNGTRTMMGTEEHRDREIARNIERVEDLTREGYPGYTFNPEIRLIVPLGAAHSPELYTSKTVTVIDISSPSKEGHLDREIIRLLREGMSDKERWFDLLKENSQFRVQKKGD